MCVCTQGQVSYGRARNATRGHREGKGMAKHRPGCSAFFMPDGKIRTAISRAKRANMQDPHWKGRAKRARRVGKNHTAADPQVSSVHLRSALIRGAKTRPGGLDPHWHRQTAKKIGSYNRNSPVVEGARQGGTDLLSLTPVSETLATSPRRR